jgi:hypothetical protein
MVLFIDINHCAQIRMHGTRQLNDQYFDVGLEESKLIETQTTTPKLQIEKSIENDQNKTEGNYIFLLILYYSKIIRSN